MTDESLAQAIEEALVSVHGPHSREVVDMKLLTLAIMSLPAMKVLNAERLAIKVQKLEMELEFANYQVERLTDQVEALQSRIRSLETPPDHRDGFG